MLWVAHDDVAANDYNPNTVAPPEMKLLELSILEDGYTQPIVTYQQPDIREVIDGFHRNRVGKECENVRKRIHGYLPVVTINEWREDRSDRIAATIRHNRARGKHTIEGMSNIVIELKRRNWSNERIGRELGMEPDEVLRLCQITGLTELFSDQDFSRAWDVEGAVTESDFQELSDNIETYGDAVEDFRTVNTSDPARIFHTHEKWECFKAGLYGTTPLPNMTKTQCEEAYRDFLGNAARFEKALNRVITEWKYSCEHYLTNAAMNRIAWLGQAAMCLETGMPAMFRSGYYLLSETKQKEADALALVYLNQWMDANGRPSVTLEEAYSGDRQSDIY